MTVLQGEHQGLEEGHPGLKGGHPGLKGVYLGLKGGHQGLQGRVPGAEGRAPGAEGRAPRTEGMARWTMTGHSLPTQSEHGRMAWLWGPKGGHIYGLSRTERFPELQGTHP